MEEKDYIPAHSVRGYLSRRSTEELKEILNDCLQGDSYKDYGDAIPIILDILEARFMPDETKKVYLCMKEKLLNEEKDEPKTLPLDGVGWGVDRVL